MKGFHKDILFDTVQSIVHELSVGGVEQVLSVSKPSRVTATDIKAVIAEHGESVTIPSQRTKAYFTASKTLPEVYTDIRLWVDNNPSDLVLRCTLYNTMSNGLYEYRVEDILAP
ncbi:DUF7668 domain-containing protein [Hymenobacter rubidus]|uniref:DUF7668 domain-containing protein n=1 Tax=Hymenobacter rubidus TaxID=1441626 RepID=UPI00191CC330|nr:hypothetical protein [Hymenobacter rubidus]